MEYNFAEIGERIRDERKKRRISQEGLIELLDANCNVKIARNRLSAIENGEENSFSLELLLGVCKIFNWDMGFLLGEYEETTKDAHDISEYTGLSEQAIKLLNRIKKKADIEEDGGWLSYEGRIIQALNTLIVKDSDLFFDIADYLFFHSFSSLGIIPDSNKYPNIRDDNGTVDAVHDTDAFIYGKYRFKNKSVPVGTNFQCSDTPDLLLLKVQRKLIKLREKNIKGGFGQNG